VTYREKEPWVSLADFLDLELAQRIKYVRTNLGLSHDKLADALGVSGRKTLISWEGGAEPQQRHAEPIASLTPYPVEAFRQVVGPGVTFGKLDLRLRELEGAVAAAAANVAGALQGLDDRIAQLEDLLAPTSRRSGRNA